MNKNILAIAFCCLLAGSGPALANEHATEHGSMQQPTTQTHSGTGTVNKVDMRNGTVNLSHGPIKSLGWLGMTMDFKVKDKSILAGIKAGGKVKFEVVKEGPGKFYIAHIEATN